MAQEQPARGRAASNLSQGNGNGEEQQQQRDEGKRSATPFCPPPPSSVSSSSTGTGNPQERGRGKSARPNVLHHSHPIKQAVDSAFEGPEVAQDLNPALIAQITEAVMKNLKATGIAPPYTAPPPTQAPPSQQQYPGDKAQPPKGGNAGPTSAPLRQANTASSPPPVKTFSSDSSSDADEKPLDGVGERIRQSAGKALERSPSPTISRRRGASSAAQDAKQDGDSSDMLLRIWQPLFDEMGNPTQRLGQFLRGLAIHIIEDFEPKHSLVITPQKMLKFYEDSKIGSEIYPWTAIFGGKISTSSLSHVYRDMECQHHYIQRQFDERPTIPGLTPFGFEAWMTKLIRAHPEEEYERFAQAVVALPINNADQRQERFPKQLVRRQFPKKPNIAMLCIVDEAIYGNPDVDLPSKKKSSSKPHLSQEQPSTTSDGPQKKSSASPSQHRPRSSQRERGTRSPQKSLSDDGKEDGRAAAPVERERKPYAAQVGGGKHYGNEHEGHAQQGESTSSQPRDLRPQSQQTPPSSGRRDSIGEGPPSSRQRDSRRYSNTGPRPIQRTRSPSTNPASTNGRCEAEKPPSSWQNQSQSSRPREDSDEADEQHRRYSRDNRRYVPDAAQKAPSPSNIGSVGGGGPPPSLPQQQQQQPPPSQPIPMPMPPTQPQMQSSSGPGGPYQAYDPNLLGRQTSQPAPMQTHQPPPPPHHQSFDNGQYMRMGQQKQQQPPGPPPQQQQSGPGGQNFVPFPGQSRYH